MSRSFAIHASMLSMLSKCGQMAMYRYMEGRKSRPGVAMLIGTGTHRSIEANLSNRIARGVPLELGEAQQKAGDAFESAWSEEPPELDEDERESGEVAVRGKAKDQTIALATLHHADVAPIIEPLSVELRLRIEDPAFIANVRGADVSVAVEGTVDVLDARRIMIDNKTAARSPGAGDADGNVQLDTYAMLLEAHGKPVDTVALDVLVKNKTPKHVRVTADAPKDHTATLLRINAAVRVMESGAFFPVDPSGPSGWVCSSRFCSFWNDVCPFGRAARRQVSVPQESK